jgi:hypothetical protein
MQALKRVWPALLRAFSDPHVEMEDLIEEGGRNKVAGIHQAEYRSFPTNRQSVTTSSMWWAGWDADRIDQNVRARDQREIGPRTTPLELEPDPADRLLGHHVCSRLRIDCWIGVEPSDDRIGGVQLDHLGYPHFFAYILGAWHVGAAVAIIAPRLPLIKEWAYAGCFFLWTGAVASHLSARDGVEVWWVPLMFATFAIASWALRPPDRRLPETRLRRDRPADAGQDGAGPPETRPRTWETRPRAWAAPIGLLVVRYGVSFLSLPAVEDAFHDRAVELGWIDE